MTDLKVLFSIEPHVKTIVANPAGQLALNVGCRCLLRVKIFARSDRRLPRLRRGVGVPFGRRFFDKVLSRRQFEHPDASMHAGCSQLVKIITK